MRKNRLIAVALMLLLPLLASSIQAEESAEDIVIKSLQTFKGDDAVGEAQYTTHLKREDRTEVVRMFRFWKAYRGVDGLHSKTLFYNTYPPQNRSAVLVWSYMPETGKPPKRWLYLPMFKSVEEINPDEAAKIPGGGDPYFYSSVLQVQQLIPRMPDQDTHKLEGTEEINGVKHYIIRSTPVEKSDDYKFDYTLNWIRSDNYLPVKTEYFRNGKKIIVKNTDWKKMGESYVWEKVVATDLRTENTTTLTFRDSRINVGLKDEVFRKESLMKSPADWLQ
ncbi:MAG: outer membrane lipoprotein-sorting protein [Gammaproteobacteria bacterium]|nr:MAG: outer membrane lipoprotein-sorting protein [Gammaproteobacteria bacterium]